MSRPAPNAHEPWGARSLAWLAVAAVLAALLAHGVAPALADLETDAVTPVAATDDDGVARR